MKSLKINKQILDLFLKKLESLAFYTSNSIRPHRFIRSSQNADPRAQHQYALVRNTTRNTEPAWGAGTFSQPPQVTLRRARVWEPLTLTKVKSARKTKPDKTNHKNPPPKVSLEPKARLRPQRRRSAASQPPHAPRPLGAAGSGGVRGAAWVPRAPVLAPRARRAGQGEERGRAPGPRANGLRQRSARGRVHSAPPGPVPALDSAPGPRAPALRERRGERAGPGPACERDGSPGALKFGKEGKESEGGALRSVRGRPPPGSPAGELP